MSLSDFYETASPRSKYKPKPCKVCVWYDSLPAILDDEDPRAVFDEKIGGNVTMLWMACVGFDANADFSLTTLRRHKQLCLTCR